MKLRNCNPAKEIKEQVQFNDLCLRGHDISDDSDMNSGDRNSIESGVFESPRSVSSKRVVKWRIAMRVLAIIIIILAFYYLPVKDWIASYLDATGTVQPGWRAAYFTAGAVTFHALSPTGYFPTVLAGITFNQLYESWPVAYVSVTLGAAINLLLVRKCLRGIAERVTKRKMEGFQFLQKMIDAKPFTTVLIFRCPYMYVGLANYLFALSKIEARLYLVANAVGFIPGSLLFVMLGMNARNLFEMVRDGDWSAEELGVLISLFAVTITCIAVGIVFGRRVLAKGWEDSEKDDKENLVIESLVVTDGKAEVIVV